MAQKSKTQKAKASAARAARKEAREAQLQNEETEVVETEDPKKTKTFLQKKDEAAAQIVANKSEKKKEVKKEEKKEKKEHFKFFKEVRSEMKRVTWPTRPEVLRWSLVVIAALVFFGVYVAFLDNAIVTPLLVLISGLGA